MGFWSWVKRYALGWGVGDSNMRSVDKSALIEFGADKHPKERSATDHCNDTHETRHEQDGTDHTGSRTADGEQNYTERDE